MSAKRYFKSSRRSIKYDRVQAADLLAHEVRFSCEDCSHFSRSQEACTLEFQSRPHRRDQQMKDFELTGHMAFCRFLEID